MRKHISRRLALLLSFLFLLPVPWTAAEELPEVPPGPLILTSVQPAQLSPDYWINRLPNPDRLLKTPEEIKVLNDDIHAMVRDTMDVLKLGTRKPGASVKAQIELEFKSLRGRGLFDLNNQVIQPAYFDQNIRPLIQTDKIPASISLRYGAAVRTTSVRALPSDFKMFEKKDDPEFDQLQFTQIKLWTPVAIYHTSKDGNWYYLQAPYIRGWVKSRDIALFPNAEALKKYVKPSIFLVVTGDRVPVYEGRSIQTVNQMASMGTVLPLKSAKPEAGSGGRSFYPVWLPIRGAQGKVSFKTAYLDSSTDISPKFLPFTQRNIIRQAFKLLGARYGWGGTYNGRDCSGFTQDVFLPFGIDMPRASKGQGFVGTQLGHFEYKGNAAEKLAVLQQAVPGITLMRMPHHQMLLVGQENGQFYVIHSTWAERYSMTSDDKNRINQIVVSDLNLNGKSYLGSLFDRIIEISEIN